MRVSKIYVTKLFGIFNHPVSLNAEDRITIIHGPNGFGKTALLRLINGFFNSQYSELLSIPFAEFRIDFDDGSYLRITKQTIATTKPTVSNHENDINLAFYFCNCDLKSEAAVILAVDSKNNFINHISNKWQADRQNPSELLPIFLLKDMPQSFDVLHLQYVNLEITKTEPKWLSELKSSIDVNFLQTQRLFALSNVPEASIEAKPPSMIPSVNIYAQELAKEIQATLAEYGALSQSLERTFPARILNNKSPADITEETLRNKLNEIEEKRSSLREIGLLERDENPELKIEKHIDNTTKNILSVYVEDVEKKLTIFHEISAKIELFTKIIKQRFLYKSMSISKEKGFTLTVADGKPLSLTDLSFGEQHELVMLYELLFKVKPNSLVLIDEPEISLHIAWQVDFLKDLRSIIELVNFDVLLATHSPDIIDDSWGLTVELKRPVE
ncbi:MAG: AAA family ATPase [Microcoleus sp. SU_5_6]|nr:AAA family ATPase [Microcoleus sp. SU_5_6]